MIESIPEEARFVNPAACCSPIRKCIAVNSGEKILMPEPCIECGGEAEFRAARDMLGRKHRHWNV